MSTPVEYYERYLNLSIPDPNGETDLATNISVSKYLLGLHDAQTNARVALLRKIQKDVEAGRRADSTYKIRVAANTGNGREVAEFSNITTETNDPLWMLIRYPFAGKGSPEGIQAVLQLACTDGPGAPALVSPDNLQRYCDELLGVDCNGFVGSFLRHEHQGVPWSDLTPRDDAVSPNNLISDIWSKAPGTVRTSAAEVDANDTHLLVLVDAAGEVIPGGKPPHGHIMISQPGESMTTSWTKGNLGVASGTQVPAICVTESTGAKKSDGTNGLARSWYHYVDDPRLKNKGVLLVDRGVNGTTMRVKIKALN
jgi:hypothetical protein